MKPIQYRITNPPAALRKARLDNIALVPASLLLNKGKYQTIANNLPGRGVLICQAEKHALDVYHHGEDRKPNMRCRTYNGYELCVYYGQNSRTGQPYISTIWKRERR